MHNHQTLYRLLLMLSGVGAVFALLAMFTSLLFPLCAIITILCYLVGAVRLHHRSDQVRANGHFQ